MIEFAGEIYSCRTIKAKKYLDTENVEIIQLDREMSTTLPLFWHLSSANKKDRIDASVKLVGSLEQFQAEFIPKEFSEESSDEEEAHEATKNDGLDNLNAQDVSYSIRRLIRGLASPRESSRLGFAVALTEVRKSYPRSTDTYNIHI